MFPRDVWEHHIVPHCTLGSLAALSAASPTLRSVCRPRLLHAALVEGRLEGAFRRKAQAQQKYAWSRPVPSRRSPVGSFKASPQVDFCRTALCMPQVVADPPRTDKEVLLIYDDKTDTRHVDFMKTLWRQRARSCKLMLRQGNQSPEVELDGLRDIYSKSSATWIVDIRARIAEYVLVRMCVYKGTIDRPARYFPIRFWSALQARGNHGSWSQRRAAWEWPMIRSRYNDVIEQLQTVAPAGSHFIANALFNTRPVHRLALARCRLVQWRRRLLTTHAWELQDALRETLANWAVDIDGAIRAHVKGKYLWKEYPELAPLYLMVAKEANDFIKMLTAG